MSDTGQTFSSQLDDADAATASVRGQRALWLAVIANAIQDIIKPTGLIGSARELARRSALLWITRPSADFKEVCALAGIEPDRVRAYAREQLARCGAELPSTKVVPPRSREGRQYEMDGTTKPLRSWCEEYNADLNRVRTRLSAGWPLKRALTAPVRQTAPRFRQKSPFSRPDRGRDETLAKNAGTGGGPSREIAAK